MMGRRGFLLAAAVSLRAQERDELGDLWNDFARQANEFVKKRDKGVFDVRLAKDVSRAWRRIEDSGYWPK